MFIFLFSRPVDFTGVEIDWITYLLTFIEGNYFCRNGIKIMVEGFEAWLASPMFIEDAQYHIR